jgi:hypothetical protein
VHGEAGQLCILTAPNEAGHLLRLEFASLFVARQTFLFCTAHARPEHIIPEKAHITEHSLGPWDLLPTNVLFCLLDVRLDRALFSTSSPSDAAEMFNRM